MEPVYLFIFNADFATTIERRSLFIYKYALHALQLAVLSGSVVDADIDGLIGGRLAVGRGIS